VTLSLSRSSHCRKGLPISSFHEQLPLVSTAAPPSMKFFSRVHSREKKTSAEKANQPVSRRRRIKKIKKKKKLQQQELELWNTGSPCEGYL
jgi:hypothetical protein